MTKIIKAKVLHRVICLRKQLTKPDSDVGIMFSQAEFLAYFTADYIMSFLLDEFSDILALESQCIETAVTDFPVGKPFLFQR